MKEEDIRPQKIFDEYLELAKQDTKNYFSDSEKEFINCPACEKKGTYVFSKNGFKYDECSACYTLYVNPRPISSALDRYYTEAPSVEFWATTFYKETAESRRELLWKPKAEQIINIVNSYLKNDEFFSLIDIGGGYGIFVEEIKKIANCDTIVIEPGPKLAEVCRSKKIKVIQKFLNEVNLNELPSSKKVYTSFELFEHLHSPKEFLTDVYNIMNKGDIFIFTTLSGTGLDISVLWDHSKSVSPPHHLNFLNPKSMPILLKKIGFKNIDIKTPGKLDIDILKKNIHLIDNRFWKHFLSMASDEDLEKMQKTIQDSCSSSHIMITCQKT